MYKTEENFFSLVKAVEEFNAKCLYYKNRNLRYYIFSDKEVKKNCTNSSGTDEKKQFYKALSDFIKKINSLHQNFLEWESSSDGIKGAEQMKGDDVSYSEEKKRVVKKTYSLPRNKSPVVNVAEKKGINKGEKAELVKAHKKTKNSTLNLSVECKKSTKGLAVKSINADLKKTVKLRNKRKIKDNMEKANDNEGESETEKQLCNGLTIKEENGSNELKKSVDVHVVGEEPNNLTHGRNFGCSDDEKESHDSTNRSMYDSESDSDNDLNEMEDEQIKQERNNVLRNYIINLEYGIKVIRMSREQLIEEIKEFYVLHNREIQLDKYAKFLNKNILKELKEKVERDNMNFIEKPTYSFKDRKSFFNVPGNHFFIRNYDSSQECLYTSNKAIYDTSMNEASKTGGCVYVHNSPVLPEVVNFGNNSILTRSNSISHAKLNSPNFGMEDQEEDITETENELETETENEGRKEYTDDEPYKKNEKYENNKDNEFPYSDERQQSPNFGSLEIDNENGEVTNDYNDGEMEMDSYESANVTQLQKDTYAYTTDSLFNTSLEFNSNNEPWNNENAENKYSYTMSPTGIQSSSAIDINKLRNFNKYASEMLISNQFLVSGDELANSCCENADIYRTKALQITHTSSSMGFTNREKGSNTDINTNTYESSEGFQNLESHEMIIKGENFRNRTNNNLNSNASDFCKHICDFYKKKESGTSSSTVFDGNMSKCTKHIYNALLNDTGHASGNKNIAGDSLENSSVATGARQHNKENSIVNLCFDDELARVQKPKEQDGERVFFNGMNKGVIRSVRCSTSHSIEFTEEEIEKDKTQQEQTTENSYEKDEEKWLVKYCEGDYNLYRSKQLKKKKESVLEYIRKWEYIMQDSKAKKVDKSETKYIESGEIMITNRSIGNIDHMSYFDAGDDNYFNNVYNTMNLKVIYEVNRSACEYLEEMRFFVGQVIVNKYRIEKIISKTKFSTTLKCLNLHYRKGMPRSSISSNSVTKTKHKRKDYKYLCLKVMKCGKSYFDQGVFELIVLNVLNESKMEYCANSISGSSFSRSNNIFSMQERDIYARGSKNIIELYDYFYFKEQLVIVTEYMQSDLYNYFMKKKKMGTLGQLQILTKKLLEGIAFIHSNNLIHCDLKPENIMITMKHKKHSRKSKSFTERDKDETLPIDEKKMYNFSNNYSSDYMSHETNIQQHKEGFGYGSGNQIGSGSNTCISSVTPNRIKAQLCNAPNSGRTKDSFDFDVSVEQQRKDIYKKSCEQASKEKGKMRNALNSGHMNSSISGLSAVSCDTYCSNTVNNNNINNINSSNSFYNSSINSRRVSTVFNDEEFDKIKIIDFNSAIYESDKLEMYVQTRSYRSPEVLLQENYDRKIDIWSLGCILFEFITTKILFDYENLYRFIYSIATYIGSFPFYMINCCKIPYMFTKHGLIVLDKVIYNKAGNKLYRDREINESDDDVIFNSQDFFRLNKPSSTCESVYRNRNILSNSKTECDSNKQVYYNVCYPSDNLLKTSFHINDVLFIDFLLSLLQIDPVKRPDAVTALSHPWLQHGLYDDGL